MQINENYKKLKGSYLFSEVAKRKAEYLRKNPDVKLINMGIGDVTRPLFPSVIKAMHSAVDEMSAASSFRGYAPEQGYAFLRELIAEHDFANNGVSITADEVFVSDGAKSDCANIGDIFGLNNTVAVCDPVYPVYVDSNIMSGRAGDNNNGVWTSLMYLPCTKENGYVPDLPKGKADMIYLCYPNNPTGAVATHADLKKWVDYANENGSVILFDAAYEAYISTPGVPHSIYEIPGAETCAIEFRSFSKSAGFTGTRCAYTIVPNKLVRSGESLHDMWNRRQATKFNGVSYVVQKGAAAVFSDEGRLEQKATIAYYMDNARLISSGLSASGIGLSGGVDSPYVWIKLPSGLDSWQAFDLLLNKANVITTPGVGFGACGEGYIRVTAFGERADAQTATERIALTLR